MFISATAFAHGLYIVLKEGAKPSLHQATGMSISLLVLTVGYNFLKGRKWARITLIILSIVGALVSADLCLFKVVRMRFDNFFILRFY